MKRKYDKYEYVDITSEILPFFVESSEKKKYECNSENFLDNISDLNNLISIGKECNTTINYNLNISILNKLVKPLTELNNMVGMENVKEQIFEQLLYYLQHLDEPNEMLHTVIQGSPGSGKTKLSMILANIYKELNILSRGHIVTAKRADLIGNYLGETSIKTQKILNNAKGGILLIDEAYSLGNPEGKDSYSKECLDTINQFLSEHKKDFILIIAGYENDLKKCFFKYNQGLKRRFNWIYTIDNYDKEHLKNIFLQNVENYNWTFQDNSFLDLFFEKNYELFESKGGDMENLFYKCKLQYAKRIVTKKQKNDRVLKREDLENVLEKYFTNEKKSEKNFMMYM